MSERLLVVTTCEDGQERVVGTCVVGDDTHNESSYSDDYILNSEVQNAVSGIIEKDFGSSEGLEINMDYYAASVGVTADNPEGAKRYDFEVKELKKELALDHDQSKKPHKSRSFRR